MSAGEKTPLLGFSGKKLRQTPCHWIVFALTFVSYALLHISRKTFSNVKSLLQDEWTPIGDCHRGNRSLYCFTEPREQWTSSEVFSTAKDAELFLGILDTVFMFMYAVGLYISGILGDRFPLTFVLSGGMSFSAVALLFFGSVSFWINVHTKGYYVTFWAVNGLLQSACWPASVAIMSNWFGKSGLVFGLWSANASVGNIIGALIASAVLRYGYEFCFLVPAVILVAGAMVNVCCLYSHPDKSGIDVDEMPSVSSHTSDRSDERVFYAESSPMVIQSQSQEVALLCVQKNDINDNKKPINFWRAWLLPGVFVYAASYACLKLVNYSLFFWLPFYLSKGLHWDEEKADDLSTLYDVGGIVGGAVAGIISDFMGYRSPIVVLLLVLAAPGLLLYRLCGTTYTKNALLMTVSGFLIGGPANLESSAISADLGRQPALQGNTEAAATVTGIIDGTGSIGAAIGQFLVSYIDTSAGWQYVFYFLMVMLLLSAAFLTRLVVREVRMWWEDLRHRRSESGPL